VHHGSGVLVADGLRVITAAHVLAAGSASSSIEVAFPSGATRSATNVGTLEARDADVCVLRMDEPVSDVTGVTLGPAGGSSESSEVVVLGYPARLGLDMSGAVVPDRPDERFPLRPLRLVCSMPTPLATRLVPVAGAIPIGGMSGGPVVDAEGRLVAIQRAVSEIIDDGRLDWRIDVVPLSPLRADLAALGVGSQ
jgi:S1-C subfamily serine protease